MVKTGVVILAHGSRGELGAPEVNETLRRITSGIKQFLSPGVEAIGAALQFNRPNLEEAIDAIIRQNVRRVVIVPYFLFPGQHVTEGIPQCIERFERDYPQIQFLVSDNLGLDEYFIDLMVKRIIEAAPELRRDGRLAADSTESIEQQSMAIVERILPPLRLSEPERTIVKRLVHTAGDRHLAPLIRFQPTVTTVALTAIRLGRPILTDVRMVAVAIDHRRAKKFGCSINCALNEPGADRIAREQGSTRSAAAFRLLDKKLNGAIVAIGNSPTALLTLTELIVKGEVAPAVVIGTPVGFVQATEAKEELMKLDIPYITVAGTRGGSAIAAATVNALLRLAEAEDSPTSMSYIKSNL
ncbi:MAG: precorrin-8X methylmutase [Chloroflexi bacterium]|nr:precorrin-8X methylmutase [Chloroflexota bacterium]